MQVIHPNKKTAGVTDGPFVDMSLGLMRSTLPQPMTLPLWTVSSWRWRVREPIDQTQF